MSVQVQYTKKTLRDLRKSDRSAAQNIVKKIRFYAEQRDPLYHARKLKPPFEDLYRYRIGDYYAIFECDSRMDLMLLTILKIGHRKDVY